MTRKGINSLVGSSIRDAKEEIEFLPVLIFHKRTGRFLLKMLMLLEVDDPKYDMMIEVCEASDIENRDHVSDEEEVDVIFANDDDEDKELQQVDQSNSPDNDPFYVAKYGTR
ncbi:hypothetical protein FQA39_LY07074 [Lamprigera yunnana]|nr:hypothetical protein FQA39_LY07074 [Lamprigera yunnana]